MKVQPSFFDRNMDEILKWWPSWIVTKNGTQKKKKTFPLPSKIQYRQQLMHLFFFFLLWNPFFLQHRNQMV